MVAVVNGSQSSSDEELVILSTVDRYPVGEPEEETFQGAVNKRPFKVIYYPLPLTKDLSHVPDDLAASVHGLFILRHFFRRENLARFPKLKVLIRTGVGYERIDRVACAEREVKVTNIPDACTNEVADHALALALSLRRAVLLQDAHLASGGDWRALTGPSFDLDSESGLGKQSGPLVQRSKGRVFGIIGLGRIGTAVAIRAKAFGWDVVFYDPLLPNGVDAALNIRRVRTVDELFSISDTISIHAYLSPLTLNIVNSHTLSLLKPGAVLINTARGDLVDVEAVYDALRSGRLAGVALDVVAPEPLPTPLPRLVQAHRDGEAWLKGRVVMSGHVAYYSPECTEDLRVKAAETMRDVLFDGLETNVIDPSAW